MKIRNFKREDFVDIFMWWNEVNEPSPTLAMLPEATTYIIEDEDKLASVCLYITNSPEICYMENLIANPKIDKVKRKEAIELLIKEVEIIAKSLGFKRLICFTNEERLNKRYEELGYRTTVNNLYSLVKEL